MHARSSQDFTHQSQGALVYQRLFHPPASVGARPLGQKVHPTTCPFFFAKSLEMQFESLDENLLGVWYLSGGVCNVSDSLPSLST